MKSYFKFHLLGIIDGDGMWAYIVGTLNCSMERTERIKQTVAMVPGCCFGKWLRGLPRNPHMIGS